LQKRKKLNYATQTAINSTLRNKFGGEKRQIVTITQEALYTVREPKKAICQRCDVYFLPSARKFCAPFSERFPLVAACVFSMKNNHQSIFAATRHASGSSLRRARHFLRCVCIFISASVDRDRGADYRWSEALGALAQAISSSTHPRHDLGDFTPDGLLCACEGESVFCELMHELLLLMKYEKNEDKKNMCAHFG
jgi:hypothetical protein